VLIPDDPLSLGMFTWSPWALPSPERPRVPHMSVLTTGVSFISDYVVRDEDVSAIQSSTEERHA
jgi:hypothetical protein